MNKELTPMMELIEFCKENQDGMLDPKEFLFKAFELLPKEKQVIEDAYDEGFSTIGMNGKDYYNTKYNNQK